MKRAKKFAWGLLGTALVLLAVWCNLPENKLAGDELKLAKMFDDWKWYSRVRILETKLPESWSRRLHLENWESRLSGSANRRRHELLASGYFTNVTILVTNLPSNLVTEHQRENELFRRLFLIPGKVLCAEFGENSNSAVAICRPEDVTRLQKGLNQL